MGEQEEQRLCAFKRTLRGSNPACPRLQTDRANSGRRKPNHAYADLRNSTDGYFPESCMRCLRNNLANTGGVIIAVSKDIATISA